jgi:hypothetical protein
VYSVAFCSNACKVVAWMMIEILALTSALFYGSADFFGGLTARRASTIATVVVSQFVGLVLLAAALPFLPAAVGAAGPSNQPRKAFGVLPGIKNVRRGPERGSPRRPLPRVFAQVDSRLPRRSPAAAGRRRVICG